MDSACLGADQTLPQGDVNLDDIVDGADLVLGGWSSDTGDLHLRAGSPAIHAGSPDEAPECDFDGVLPDLGAFEHTQE